MPAERLPMRKIREVLRLKYACGASDRVISRSVGIGRTAIAEYVRRDFRNDMESNRERNGIGLALESINRSGRAFL